MQKRYIIDLGGSIACPEDINSDYLLKFRRFIKKYTAKGVKFIIVIGGGHTARKYQKAGLKLNLSKEDRDWLGIAATRINAVLLKGLFGKDANPVVFSERFKIKSFGRYPIIIASGWSPGWSTDYVSLRIAADFNIKKVIVLGRPDYVYTSDFDKDKKAEPIERISWKEYSRIIPEKWEPGMSVPVDPIAARLARKENLEAIVAFGGNLDNLDRILKEKSFKGTTLF